MALTTFLFAPWAIVLLCLVTPASAQTEKLQGHTYRAPGGTTLRLMLDESNVGSDVTLGEMVFPPNSRRAPDERALTGC